MWKKEKENGRPRRIRQCEYKHLSRLDQNAYPKLKMKIKNITIFKFENGVA